MNVIDIEASGLAWDSYPIEIAIVINNKTHCWLIKPETDWTHWDMQAEALHGISQAQLIDKGKSAKTVAKEINRLTENGNRVLYSDAARWDGGWFTTLFETVGIEQKAQVLPIQDLMDEDQFDIFAQTFEKLAESGNYRLHRADSDAEMIYQSYLVAHDS